jgi:hypothetical protein
VATVLETLGLQYSIGGSVASSFSGEPRATLDIDMLVALDESHVEAIVAVLQNEFYVDRESLARAARDRPSTTSLRLKPARRHLRSILANHRGLELPRLAPSTEGLWEQEYPASAGRFDVMVCDREKKCGEHQVKCYRDRVRPKDRISHNHR